MVKSQAYYRAHTNIALIKYWGKRNNELFLPMTNSLSLTLDAFYTDTKVTLTDDGKDTFILNGTLQPPTETKKLTRFINLFRKLSGRTEGVTVESVNHVPTAAGLASSSSAYAALASALNDAFELHLSPRELSTYARQGSGSASRSLFGGLVEWQQGIDDISESSYAEQIDSADWGLAMLVAVINSKEKAISSRSGMEQTVLTSPFYKLWPEEVEKDLIKIKRAIADRDFDAMGAVAEHNAMKMHATTIAANPSFTYWAPESVATLQYVQMLRNELGFSCYATMDAGPNVKILCPADQIDDIAKHMLSLFDADQLIKAYPGPAPYALPLD